MNPMKAIDDANDTTATKPKTPVWPALLVAPLLALGNLSLGYALVTPSCAHQDGMSLHAVAAVSLLLALAMTALAARAWGRLAAIRDATGADAAVAVTRAPTTASDATDRASRPPFVALVALLAGALSCLVIAAMWLPIWLLPACS
jgi:hypothetical protein